MQRKPVRVWRDNDRDAQLEGRGPGIEGLYGINIHAPTHEPLTRDVELVDVGLWSAGCQVFASSKDYRAWWALVQRAAAKWGSVFTYTLIEG